MRTATLAGLNAENKCKWRELNKLFAPDSTGKDADWQKARDAARWDSKEIPDRIFFILEDAWTIEQAAMSRAEADRAKDAQRHQASLQRKERRHSESKPLKKFLKSKHLSIVHEAESPTKVDEVAAENPLSQQYKNRRKRKRSQSPTPSPPSDPELEEEAAAKGVKIVAKHKAKRQETGEAVAEAKAALLRLPEAARTAVVEELTQSQLHPRARGRGRSHRSGGSASSRRSKSAKQAEPAPRVDDPVAIEAYYQKKLAEIDAERERDGKGKLRPASRTYLHGLCKVHYKDEASEHAFGGSALEPRWDAQFTDLARHPASTDEEEKKEEEKKEEQLEQKYAEQK